MRLIYQFQKIKERNLIKLMPLICGQLNLPTAYSSENLPRNYRYLLEQFTRTGNIKLIRPFLEQFADLRLFGGFFFGRYSAVGEIIPSYIQPAVSALVQDGKMLVYADMELCSLYGVSGEELGRLEDSCRKIDMGYRKKNVSPVVRRNFAQSVTGQNRNIQDISLGNPDICIVSSGIFNLGRGKNPPKYDVYFLPTKITGDYLNTITFNHAWSNKERTSYQMEFLQPFPKKMMIRSILRQNGYGHIDASKILPEDLMFILKEITAKKTWSAEAVQAREYPDKLRTIDDTRFSD